MVSMARHGSGFVGRLHLLVRHPKAWPLDPRVSIGCTGWAAPNSWMPRPSLGMTTESEARAEFETTASHRLVAEIGLADGVVGADLVGGAERDGGAVLQHLDSVAEA